MNGCGFNGCWWIVILILIIAFGNGTSETAAAATTAITADADATNQDHILVSIFGAGNSFLRQII